jgi:hypothetical protein
VRGVSVAALPIVPCATHQSAPCAVVRLIAASRTDTTAAAAATGPVTAATAAAAAAPDAGPRLPAGSAGIEPSVPVGVAALPRTMA